MINKRPHPRITRSTWQTDKPLNPTEIDAQTLTVTRTREDSSDEPLTKKRLYEMETADRCKLMNKRPHPRITRSTWQTDKPLNSTEAVIPPQPQYLAPPPPTTTTTRKTGNETRSPGYPLNGGQVMPQSSMCNKSSFFARGTQSEKQGSRGPVVGQDDHNTSTPGL